MRREPTTKVGQLWYRLHPGGAIFVAACLFAAVTVVRLATTPDGDSVDVLYVLPVALMAVAFGERGGLGGAFLGLGFIATIDAFHPEGSLGAIGWATRAIALFLLGALLGHATDRKRELHRWALAEQERRVHLEELAQRERAALEINDSLIQGMVAAKWLVELDKGAQAIDTLTATIENGEHLVAELMALNPIGDDHRVMHFQPTREAPRVPSGPRRPRPLPGGPSGSVGGPSGRDGLELAGRGAWAVLGRVGGRTWRRGPGPT